MRIAVGASPADVYRLVIGEGLRLTAIGLGAGVVMALAASKPCPRSSMASRRPDVTTFTAVIGTLRGSGDCGQLPSRPPRHAGEPDRRVRSE